MSDFVLLRDDCSTDNTVEFVEKYISTFKLSNWFIMKNDKNEGWGANCLKNKNIAYTV